MNRMNHSQAMRKLQRQFPGWEMGDLEDAVSSVSTSMSREARKAQKLYQKYRGFAGEGLPGEWVGEDKSSTMKQLIERLEEAKMKGFLEFFADLIEEERDTNVNKSGSDKRGNLGWEESLSYDDSDAAFMLTWNSSGSRIQLSLNCTSLNPDAFEGELKEKEAFRITPGVHEEMAEWVLDEIDDMIDELEDEMMDRGPVQKGWHR